MKNNYTYILIIVLCFVLGCKVFDRLTPAPAVKTTPAKDGKLTSEKAQATIERWANSGQVTVRGIQESNDNTAQADITFTNFHYGPKGGGAMYSGPGIAVFKHYSDGRWVLTGVSTSQGFNSVWWDNLNIEVY